MITDEEKPIFVAKPNIMLNFLITLLKFSIPAALIVGLLFYFKMLNIITNDNVFKFLIVAIVFVFTAIILFVFIYEQNRKLEFFEGGVKYSDMFESREIPRLDVEDIYYKKNLINSFVLKKKGTDRVIIIHYVTVDKDYEDSKNKFMKKETVKQEEKKVKKLSLAQLKRKYQIEDIVTGKRTVIIKHPKKKKDYLDVKEVGEEDFIDMKKLKLKVNEEFPNLSAKKRKDIFDKLKIMKKEADVFKKIKELKK